MEPFLDNLYARSLRHPFAIRFVWFCRALLSVGYLAPGLTKALGHRFTIVPISEPVGFFFEALFRSGLYWHFLGWAQIVAATMVLFTPTAPLGAFLFLGIATNVVVITLSMAFAGTPLITTAMFLASLYLVAWEYPRWKLLLPGFQTPGRLDAIPAPSLTTLELWGLRLFIVGGWLATLPMRGIQPFSLPALILFGLGIGSASLGGLIGLVGWIRVNQGRTGSSLGR